MTSCGIWQWLKTQSTMASAKPLLNGTWNTLLLAYVFIQKFLKDTWRKLCQMKEIFTINRIVASIAFGLEAASATLEQISEELTDEHGPHPPNHPKLCILTLLAFIVSLLSLLLALFEMRHKVRRSSRWVDLKVECFNIGFALVQTICSLFQFILIQFYHTKYPIRFSFLPLIFALNVLVLSFISHRTDIIRCRLVCGHQTHNRIGEKDFDGAYVIRCCNSGCFRPVKSQIYHHL